MAKSFKTLLAHTDLEQILGRDDVPRYLIAMSDAECAHQQIYSNFSI